MRVLVADRLPETSLEEMKALGVEVSYQPELTADALPAALDEINVLVVRGMEVSGDAIKRASALNLIIRAGADTSAIDAHTASERGIYVANCPGKNAAAVAELTFALAGCLDRRIPDAVKSLRAGRWEKDDYARAVGLRGQRIGIAGLGHVGRSVARLAHAYEMQVWGWSRTLTHTRAETYGIHAASNLEDLARHSDIFSIHLDLTERTRGIVGREVIDALPDGAFFINTAQAELVDYAALVELAPKKNLRVGLDVLPGEPLERSGSYSHEILGLDCVYATPHIGASTDEAQQAIANECVRILRSFLTRGEVPNVINIGATSRARYQLVVRHLDRIGALANVLGVIKRHGINIQEVSNTVFEGGKAACAKVGLDSRPSDALMQEIMAFDDEVLHVDLVTLPNLA